MEQAGNNIPMRGLDFTENGRAMEQQKIIVPGVGIMTIEEAEESVAPGKILESHIEFHENYSIKDLQALQAQMEKFKYLFSEDDSRRFVDYIKEIERKILIKQALEKYYNEKGGVPEGETVH